MMVDLSPFLAQPSGARFRDGHRRRYFILWLTIVALGGVAVEAAPEKSPGVVEAFNALDVPFQPPHTRWAKPYAEGRIRVLFITPRNPTEMLGTTRYVVETVQRFDIEADVVMTVDGAGEPYGDPGEGESAVFGGKHGEQRLARLLEVPYDCYVLKRQDAFARLPQAARETIMQRVKAGAGLVTQADEESEGKILSQASKLGQVPEFLGERRVQTYTLGRGRLALVEIGRGWSLLHATPEDKIFGVDVKRDVSYEAVGRGILWAAGRETKGTLSFDLAATMDRTDAAFRKVGIAWQVVEPRAATLRMRVFSQVTGTVHRAAVEIQQDRQDRHELTWPPLPAGSYWLHAEIRSGRGVEAWGLRSFEVTADEGVGKVELDRQWGEPGNAIEGTVQVRSGRRDQRTLVVRAIDRYRRVLAQRTVPAPEAEVRFTLPIFSWMPGYLGVEAVLMAGDQPVASRIAFGPFTVPQRKQDRWNFVMWGRLHAHQSLDIAEEMMARCGVTSRIETTSVPWWQMSRAGMNYVSYTQSGLHRQGWYGHGTPKAGWRKDIIPLDEQGVMRDGCWNGPHVDDRLRSWLKRENNYREHGVLAYSMGDEKDFWGACLHPACLDAYRRYLENQYATIDALNASWSTTFASFEDVVLSRPDDNSEQTALAAGNLPRHFDRIAFQAHNFGRYAGRFRDRIRELDPRGLAGVEGAGWMFDDLDLIVRNTDWWILYGIPAAEVVRSIAPPGYLIGHWVGYSDTNPKYPVSDFWLSFLRGGNSIGYWHAKNFLGPTLGPAPLGGGEVVETGRVVFDGYGTLLNLRSVMQHDGIVLLHAFASAQASYAEPGMQYGVYSGWVTNSEGDKWLKPGGDNQFLWHRAIRAVGLQFEYVTDRMLRQDEFVADDYRVMVLPQCEALGNAEVAAVRRFVEQGGTVIADIRPALYDGHLKLRDGGGALDDLFGVRHTANVAPETATGVVRGAIGSTLVEVDLPNLLVNPAVTLTRGKALGHAGATPICIIHETGRGRAVLLNFPINAFPNLSVADTAEAGAEFLAALFAEAGVQWPLRLQDETGKRARDVEAVRWKTGFGEEVVALYGPLHDTRAQWNPKEGQLERIRAKDVVRPIRVTLPSPRHVRRVGTEDPFRHTDEITVSARPWRPVFLALSDGATDSPRVTPARRAAERGQFVHFEVKVPGAQGLRALKVRVTAPNGAAANWFDQTLVVDGTGQVLRFPVAWNEQTGKWTVRVTDLSSDRSGEAHFVVQ